MKSLVSKLLSNKVKQRIRESTVWKQMKARRLASNAKRIDLCAAQFAHVLHLSKFESLEGKVCLEIGSGWVLTHALVCYLLGAKKVVATDIEPNARPDNLSIALRQSIDSIPRDFLSPFSNYPLVRERYNRLRSIKHFNFDILKSLGVEYLSPVDLAVERIRFPVDFIFSFSVLEHVPADSVSKLIQNLGVTLSQGGAMIHCIHLEDHGDMNKNPFGFLNIPESRYTHLIQSIRGNRIRCSEWMRLFANLHDCETRLLYKYTRPESPVPEAIDSSVSYSDVEDLRVSHIGVYTRKISCAEKL